MRGSLLAVSRGRLWARELPDLYQEGRYAAAMDKSREKGSRNLTCPKVDMPKSR